MQTIEKLCPKHIWTFSSEGDPRKYAKIAMSAINPHYHFRTEKKMYNSYESNLKIISAWGIMITWHVLALS